ncbi:MAG: hypothetical protein PHE89_00280 [Alphaproteobacteria bacterium]|nr:hypothetical protein [Alphaproteobacteria bacterium]
METRNNRQSVYGISSEWGDQREIDVVHNNHLSREKRQNTRQTRKGPDLSEQVGDYH